MYKQLDLFPESREEKLMREIEELRHSADKSRKSQFAKINELKKMCHDTKNRLDILESAICKKEFVLF